MGAVGAGVPVTREDRARRVAWAGVAGPVAFALGIVVAATQVDGYSHVRDFASELAARGSAGRAVMTAGFVAFGTCIVLVAGALRVLWPTVVGVAVLVALSGFGTVAAGAFSCDPGCPTEGTRSTGQVLHDVVSVATFVLWIAAMLLTGWRRRREPYGRACLALGAIAAASFAVLGSLQDAGPDAPVGLVQRIMLAAVGAWFVLTAHAARTTTTITNAPRDEP